MGLTVSRTCVGANPPPIGRTFGTPEDYAELDANLKAVKAYMDRTGRVPFVGVPGSGLRPDRLHYTTPRRGLPGPRL